MYQNLPTSVNQKFSLLADACGVSLMSSSLIMFVSKVPLGDYLQNLLDKPWLPLAASYISVTKTKQSFLDTSH